MIARYDLRRHHPNFDFFTWLCHVKTLGANEIVIQSHHISNMLRDEWGIENVRERVESILKPGPALADLPCREGQDGEDIGTGAFAKFVKAHGPDFAFPRLHTVLQPRDNRYTVTLRKSTQKPWRNSNEDVWRTFADRVGALIIEDYSVKPISLHERVAIYAGAKMNFFVPSGPAHLLWFTDYPFTVVGCNVNPDGFWKMGIEPESSVPWLLADQHLLWETPTVDVLMRAFDRYA